MKMNKVLALLLSLVIVLSSFGQMGEVKAATTTTKNIQLDKETPTNYTIQPGTVTHMKVPVSFLSSLNIPEVELSTSINAPFTTGDVTLLWDTSTPANKTYETITFDFDINMKDSAKVGSYLLNMNFKYKSTLLLDADGNPTDIVGTITLVINVLTEMMPAEISIDNIVYEEKNAAIGKSFILNFDSTNVGEITAYNIYASIDYGTSGLAADYNSENVKIGKLAAGEKSNLTVPITVLRSATVGLKMITVHFRYKDKEGVEKENSKNIYITIKEKSEVTTEGPKLQLSGSIFNQKVPAGTEISLDLLINNIGGETAKDIVLIAAEGVGTATGIVPRYTTDGIDVPDLKAGGSKTVSIPLMVSEDATAGLRAITFKVTYIDGDKVNKTALVVLYLTVETEASADKTTSEMLISNVKQSPENPTAGQHVQVTFDITNKGNKEITGLKIAGSDLSSAGFEPVDSEPYQAIGTIASGATKTVNMEFVVGKSIPAGMNKLNIAYSYKDADKTDHAETAVLYILNVINDAQATESGKPKLIISNFTTDEDELKAGSTFNFIFSLKNTHASKAANNIKVTITQADNVFSATKGSNSFYINSIAAGEEVENIINMKVKADATTGSFDVIIKVEYEYDDMSKTDTDNGGVSEENKIKLSAVENARPVVENINLNDAFTYGTPTIGSNCNLTFEFYNMGRSPLNNVYISIEGGFSLANGTMHYIGTVAAGSAEYVEPEVMPLIEGDTTCTIVVHFEDSNGNEVTKATDYATFVASAAVIDDGGYIDPGMDGGDPSVPVDVAKEPILKTWLFIVLQVAILLVCIPVSRGIILAVYKAKLRKKMEKENENQ